MRVIRVCKGICGNKKAVWIDGGIHAREWISPAAVSWMLRELVENDDNHPDLTSVLDWHFLVSHNPDGYEYSRTNNRFWRKTRSHTGHWSCMGVDGNRNYGFQWNQGGSSNNQCSDVYHGSYPWSEIETANVRDYILARKGQWIFYNSIHAYGNMILFPYGYTHSLPADYNYMVSVANIGANALKSVNGNSYSIGTIPGILYIASGSSVDWAYGDAGIVFSTTMELSNGYGFVLPPERIISVSQETWAFHETVMRYLMPKCPENWTLLKHNSKCVQYFDVQMSRNEAINECQQFSNNKATLVSIHDCQTNYILSSFSHWKRFWTGGQRQDGGWKWLDGTAWDYERWSCDTDPDIDNQDFVMVEFWKSRVGSWITADESKLAGVMCQMDAQQEV